MADFLLSLFNEGRQIATIRGYRSAIASIHEGFSDGSSVSSSEDLTKLVKGMFLRRPTVRTLHPPWNLTAILEALAKPPFEPLGQASLRHVTLKAVFLVAAATARRRGALQALSVAEGHMRFKNEGVRLVPDPRFLTKTQCLEFLPDPIFLPKISSFSGVTEDRLWCPVRALRLYMKRVQPLRGSSTRLWLSLNQPHAPVSADTISRWLVEVIRLDTSLSSSSTVRAHQIRGMAGSAALFRGTPVHQIMAAATWRSATTFSSFYLKDISAEEARFASSILLPSATRSLSRH